MAGIYFYNYNNYYNRRLKREETLEAYGTPVYFETQNLNFNPADGVNTVYVAGRQNNPYTGTGNYVIYSADNTTITSRWFIIEQTRNLQGQYNVQLRRDVVADYYNNILVSPAFIEKAILKDSDPLIYNDEQMTVNQIKTAQCDIYDGTVANWIVGYLDRKYDGGEVEIEGTTISDIAVTSLADWDYYKYTTTAVKHLNDISLRFYIPSRTIREGTIATYDYYFGEMYLPLNGSWSFGDISTSFDTGNPYIQTPFTIEGSYKNLAKYFNDNFDKTKWNNYYKEFINDFTSYNEVDYNSLNALQGKILLDKSTNKFYKISISDTYSKPYTVHILDSSVTATECNRVINSYQYYHSNDSSLAYRVAYTYASRKITLEETTVQKMKVSIPTSINRYHLKDAPYDMFCIPYADNYEVLDKATNYTWKVTHSKQQSMTIAQGLAQALGTNLYDIQLLPFCPFTGYYMLGGRIMALQPDDPKRYTLLKSTTEPSTNLAVMIWCTASSRSFNANVNFNYKLYEKNIKVGSQCDKVRIVSPNYNGIYEFNPGKNGGLVQNFNVAFTYLPYQPFIRIKPQFGGIYAPSDGEQFDDATGLICQGDFSLSYLSDKWAQYQIQNKNYNNIFDREVKNLELRNNIARDKEAWQIASNVFSGVTNGLMTGAITGGGLVGGLVGGAIGGVGSFAAGLKDREVNETLRQEALDYKNDMFGYQLGNIKALPNSITKVTAYNIINNVFPIVEFYTCTKEEKKAVANKIAWNSMTVGRIDSIINYINNNWEYAVSTEEVITDQGYIKAKIIRIDGIADDFHLLNAISDELNKGVYFK